MVQTDWENSAVGRRVVAVYGGSVGTPLLQDSASTPSHSGAAMRFYPGPFYMAGRVAGTSLFVAVRQTRGSALNLNEVKVGIIYLGAGA